MMYRSKLTLTQLCASRLPHDRVFLSGAVTVGKPRLPLEGQLTATVVLVVPSHDVAVEQRTSRT